MMEFIERLPWPALVLDGEEFIVAANDAMRRSGREADRMIGQSLSEAFPQYHESISGVPAWDGESEAEVHYSLGGVSFHERLIMRPIPGRQQKVLFAVDETRLHELGHEHMQTQRMASLGFMAASICHEVSNPLSAIHSLVQILQSEHGRSPETMEKGLATIASNIQRILAITRELNDFSRVSERERRAIRVDAPIEAALALLRSDRRCLGQVQIDHAPANDLLVQGNAEQLQQVFYNLFVNAVQAMDGTGSLHIAARRLGEECAEVAIADSGPGIDPRHMERLFEPFFTTKTGGDGTGLGLAICNEIVQEHMGRLRVDSTPGDGTTFFVELPLWDKQRAA